MLSFIRYAIARFKTELASLYSGFGEKICIFYFSVIMFYFLIVVRSLMLTMEEEKNPVQLPVPQEMQVMVKNQEPLMA